jgi:hypothetical protein
MKRKMKKISHSVLISILLFFSFSCNKINYTLNGFWAVDYLEYKGKEILMAGNGISFTDNMVKYPFLFISDETVKMEKIESLWRIEKNNDKSYSISFETENQIFHGTHYLKFLKISNKAGDYGLKMIIYSDEFYLEATKSIVFKKEDNFYNRAENLTKFSPPPKYEVARFIN